LPPKAPRAGSLPPAQATGTENQPVSQVQWIDRELLHANDWNPNRVVTPEMRLLAVSILEDGWTQPIVCLPDFTVIDGFHRWSVSGWPEVHAMTFGLVPVAVLRADTTEAQQRMATVRHNRARGTHYVLSMAEIVTDLTEMGVSDADIGTRLQMEAEEVVRLRERGEMIRRGAVDEFGQAWKPVQK
jgi:ParB-like chromosome segregation protein Spo0J